RPGRADCPGRPRLEAAGGQSLAALGDGAVVAAHADFLAHGIDKLLAIFLRHRLLELALDGRDDARLAERVAGYDLVDLDDEEAAALRVGDHPALALAEAEEELDRRRHLVAQPGQLEAP